MLRRLCLPLAAAGAVIGLGVTAHAQAPDAPPGGGDAAELAPLPIDLSGPQATVRSFLLTMQAATAERPESIDRAIQCLDVDYLREEPDALQRSRRLAALLFDVLNALTIDPAAIEAASRRRQVVIQEFEPLPGEREGHAISLTREEDRWRFSEETLRDLTTLRALSLTATADGGTPGESVRAAFASPRATMSTFLSALNREVPDAELAADCLLPVRGAGTAWPVVRDDFAYALYAVLLRVRPLVLTTVPERIQDDHFTWFVHRRGRIVLERATETDADRGIWRGEWRFSQPTVDSLVELYQAFGHQPLPLETIEAGYRERLSAGLQIGRSVPASLQHRVLGLRAWKVLGLVLLLLAALLAYALSHALARLSFVLMSRFGRFETTPYRRKRLFQSVGLLAMFTVVFAVIHGNYLLLPLDLLGFIHPLSLTLVGATAALVGLRVVTIAQYFHRTGTIPREKASAGLALPLLESFFRFAIAAIFIAFFLSLLGFTDTAVLGGLGIFGAAVGFAAQGTLANIVAAISIIYDQPFRVGDWVHLNGMDATVERLGPISVRIRTFYDSLLVIPNSHFLTNLVDNYGERRYRRLKTYLRLRYDTPPDRIDSFCEGLRELVRLHPYMRKDVFHIYLNELTPSSADVLVYVYFLVPDWATELRERHRFLIDALTLARELGIELAFPTQRLLLEQVEREGAAEAGPVPKPDGTADAIQEAIDEGRGRALALFHRTYGRPPRPRAPVVIQPTDDVTEPTDDVTEPNDGVRPQFDSDVEVGADDGGDGR
ncbi:MAG: mechanosensitive ion channel family protein [Sandaracinaceae bacterium]